MKVDCITVSTSPVKSVIDDIITKLFDTIVISLRRSIVNNYNSLDSFVTKSQEDLNQVPQTIEEMGDVNDKYQKIVAQKDEVKSFLIGIVCFTVLGRKTIDYINYTIKSYLTLSWRRPLSYINWTGFYMITASVMKGLITREQEGISWD